MIVNHKNKENLWMKYANYKHTNFLPLEMVHLDMIVMRYEPCLIW